MHTEAPPEVRRLVELERQRERDQIAAARARARRDAREQRLREQRATALARPALAWSRRVAKNLTLPTHGLEVFSKGERARTTVRVLPDGALQIDHVFLPYGGSRTVGRRPHDLKGVSVAVLEALVATLEDGSAWEHARQALERSLRT